jgi:integrase
MDPAPSAGMPPRRPWRGSVRAKKGWLLLRLKDETGKWVERSSGIPDTPEGWRRAERKLADAVERSHAREDATGSTAPVTVRAWAKRWIADRRRAGVRDADNDESRLELHVLPELGELLLEDVKPRHLDALARAWALGGKAPRTRRNIYSVVKALFRDARIAGLLDGADPCILTHRQLGKIRDGVQFKRGEAVFSRDELELLVRDERVPVDRRVWYGLLGIGMLRTGEAAGLRWGKVQPADPLGRLVVDRSYDGPTKTGDPRWMPAHPALAALLAEWKLGGWPRAFGRPPTPEDLVVPVTAEPRRKGRRKDVGEMRDKNYARKRLLVDLVKLELRHRRAHDLRRTGISLARSDGADKETLRWGTHAAPQTVMDLYTSLEWQAVCREVAKLKVGGARAAAGGTQS